MRVQTVRYNTLYGGDQRRQLCESCTTRLRQTIDDNARTNHWSYRVDEGDDWHEGECSLHTYVNPSAYTRKHN